MSRERDDSAFAAVQEIQIANLASELKELKARVEKLESTIARGVMLLVANLAAVIMSLGQQLLHP